MPDHNITLKLGKPVRYQKHLSENFHIMEKNTNMLQDLNNILIKNYYTIYKINNILKGYETVAF